PRLRVRAARIRRSAGRSLLAANTVHRPAGSLPGVVRGARAEVGLVGDDARVPADFLRTPGVTQQVGIVTLLPHEHEVRRSHEFRNERAPGRRTRKWSGGDAVPPSVTLSLLAGPDLFVDLRPAVLHNAGPSDLEVLPFHAGKVAPMSTPTT